MTYDPEVERSPFTFPLRRPVTVTMVVLTGLVLGFLSYQLLPIDIMPPINYPSLTVQTEYEGAGPEEVEETVTKPLEQNLAVVKNLVSITSSSRPGISEIHLEFSWDTDINQAIQDVRERLDQVILPEEVGRVPIILRFDPNLDPLMRIALVSSEMSTRELRQLAEDVVQRELEKVKGVAAVKVKGGEEAEIHLSINPAAAELLNIPLETIARRLQQENISLASGTLEEGTTEYILRAQNEFLTLADIDEMIVEIREGKAIRIRDLAKVSRTGKEIKTLTRIDGQPSVELEIYREGDANPVTVSERVHTKLFGDKKTNKTSSEEGKGRGFRWAPPPLSQILSPGAEIKVVADQARFIKRAIDEVKSSALYGGLLAILVLFFFLTSLKETLVIAFVIPISAICTFAAMKVFGLSLNIMSLGGLALGIGMLVDNAIVVVESIWTTRKEEPDQVKAIIKGTAIVGSAVVASTLTTVVIFFPIIFVTGIARQIFGDLAFTIITSLMISLILALFFVPMVIHKLTNPQDGQERSSAPPTFPFTKPTFHHIPNIWRGWIKRWRLLKGPGKWASVIPGLIFLLIYSLFDILTSTIRLLLFSLIHTLFAILNRPSHPFSKGILSKRDSSIENQFKKASLSLQNGINSVYLSLLTKSLRFPAASIVLAIILVSICVVEILPQMGGELIPRFSQGTFNIHLQLPVGTPLAKTLEVSRALEEKILTHPGVLSCATRVGEELESGSEVGSGSHMAILTVQLHSGRRLREREDEIISLVRDSASNIPDLDIRVSQPTLFTFKSPIELVVRRDNLEELKAVNRQVVNLMEGLPFLNDVESSVKSGYPEVVIEFNRIKLAHLGLNAYDAAQRVKTMVQGSVPTYFREGEKRLDLRVNLQPFHTSLNHTEQTLRNELDFLRTLVINPEQPTPVTLQEVATIKVEEGLSEIRHFGGNRAAIITANLTGWDIEHSAQVLSQHLENMGLLPGVDFILGGQKKELESSLRSLQLALALALFLVYSVMASQFESLKSPLLIIITVPVSLAGVLFALYIGNISLSVMVLLGFIILVGIVVNNAIVLVDYIHKLRRQGMKTEQAIPTACQRRLRPILMTTLTTVLGLTPMALGLGEGAEIRQPMAITVIIGLTFSLLVSLILVPTLYKVTSRT